MRVSDKWVYLTVLSIGTFIVTLDGGMVGLIYPALIDAFDSQSSDVIWVSVCYWVTAVGLMHTLGWMGDVAGRKLIYMLGLVVLTLGIVFSSISPNLPWIIVSRIGQGIGAAMILSNLNAYITDIFPSNETGKALGISGSVVGFGLTLGPLLGGVLLEIDGWRALFYSRIPLGIGAAILAYLILPKDSVKSVAHSIEIRGVVVIFICLSSILISVNQFGKSGIASPVVVITALLFLIFLPLVIWSEKKSLRPIIEVSLLRSRNYSFGILSLVLHYLAHGAVLLAGPFLLLTALEFSPGKAGLMMAAFSAPRILLAPVAGRAYDRFGPRYLLIFGNLMIAIGLFLISQVELDSYEYIIWVGMLAGGIGASLFEPVVTSAIMSSVPKSRLGTASASVGVGRQVAFAMGLTLSGAVYAFQKMEYAIKTDWVQDVIEISALSDTLLGGAFIAVLAILISSGLKNKDN